MKKSTPAKMKPAKTMPVTSSEIPKFATIQEEAEFWDTHSTEDFAWEDVDDDEGVEFIGLRLQKKQPMTVRLEPDIITLLTQEAKSQGIGPSTLARMVILKHLKDSGTGTYIKRPKKPAKRPGVRGVA